jgi:hypothetical protein
LPFYIRWLKEENLWGGVKLILYFLIFFFFLMFNS